MNRILVSIGIILILTASLFSRDWTPLIPDGEHPFTTSIEGLTVKAVWLNISDDGSLL